MSHVDDGSLHAYLDGELDPVERERLEGHLATCPPCRARLVEERTLIAQAGRILDLAVPAPKHAAPPLDALRRPPAWWQVRVPLAWAATVVLALGLGWYLGGRGAAQHSGEPVDRVAMTAPTEPASTKPGQAPTPPRDERQQARPPALAPASRAQSVAVADRAAHAESSGISPPAVPSPAPQVAAQRLDTQPLRDEPTAAGRIAAAMPAAPAALEADRPARTRLATTWATIEPKTARDLLGTVPVTIPGYPVLALRRSPEGRPGPEILVEQQLGDDVVIRLFERPVDDSSARPARQAEARQGAAQRANERLARFVGSLRVEIMGPLPADSLSHLLQLVR